MSQDANEPANVVFVLGAGFCADAAAEAQNPSVVLGQMTTQPQRHWPKYPLVADLARICFGLDAPPTDTSIEQMFGENMTFGPDTPIDRLAFAVMEADHYIASRLRADGETPNNVYARFLADFPDAPLLTFNYDALPELIMLSHGHWRPDDGFGVPVEGAPSPFPNDCPVAERSLRPVLHLHGSLYVYAVVSEALRLPERGWEEIRLLDEPRFVFDPHSLAYDFRPFARPSSRYGFVYPDQRIIAPVPDKAEARTGEFIDAVYAEAARHLSRADIVVAIGYSFNRHDEVSYAPLVEAARGRNVLVVTPSADDVVSRLRDDFPAISWAAAAHAFGSWVQNGYPGLTR